MGGGRVRKEWDFRKELKETRTEGKERKSSLGKEGLVPWKTPLGSRECPRAGLWKFNLREGRVSQGGQDASGNRQDLS